MIGYYELLYVLIVCCGLLSQDRFGEK